MAATTGKLLLFFSLFLGGLYILYRIFTHKLPPSTPFSSPRLTPPSSPISSQKSDRRNNEEKPNPLLDSTTQLGKSFVMVVEDSETNIVIISCEKEISNQAVVSQYHVLVLHLIAQRSVEVKQTTITLMGTVGSSEAFQEKVNTGDIKAFEELITALHQTFAKVIKNYEHMPEIAKTLNTEAVVNLFGATKNPSE